MDEINEIRTNYSKVDQHMIKFLQKNLDLNNYQDK